jgi:hypothetical protein
MNYSFRDSIEKKDFSGFKRLFSKTATKVINDLLDVWNRQILSSLNDKEMAKLSSNLLTLYQYLDLIPYSFQKVKVRNKLFSLESFEGVTDFLGITNAGGEPVLMKEFKKVGKKPGGSVPGALYIRTGGGSSKTGGSSGTGGSKFVIKYTTREVSLNEVLSGTFYRESGLKVPNFLLVDPENILPSGITDQTKLRLRKPYLFVASSFVDNLATVSMKQQVMSEDILDGFLIDSWLGNYDVIGLEYDNIMRIPETREMIRIDIGASLRYKAQGGPKGQGFNFEALETEFLRGKCYSKCLKSLGFSEVHEQIMHNAAKIFDNLKWRHVRHGIELLNMFSDERIRRIADRDTEIAELLIERRDVILNGWVPLLMKNILT